MYIRKHWFSLILGLAFGAALCAQGFQGGGQRPPGNGDRRPPGGGDRPPMQGEQPGEFGQQELQGYLVDCNWGTTGKDDNGKDLAKKPALITLKHLKSESSTKAGYGILVQTPGRDFKFIKFDKSGNLRALDYLRTCKKKNKIYIQVKGYVDKTGTITVMALDKGYKSAHSSPGGPGRGGSGGRPPMGGDMGGMGNN